MLVSSSNNYGFTILITSSSWWFGTWFFMTFHILGISSSQLTFIFFGGVAQPPTSVVFDGCDLETLNIFEWEFMRCDGDYHWSFFLLLMIWMRCDWILRNFRSECCCVLFLQFWTVEQDASSKKCDEMCCQDGLAFSIWDFTIKHIQIFNLKHPQTKDLMGFTMVIVNWEQWVRQSIT